MHTIYEVVDASVNHSSGSSKTLRVKLTVSPEPSSKRKECLTGQGEGSMPGAFLFRCHRLYEHCPSDRPIQGGPLLQPPDSHLFFPVALTSPPLTPALFRSPICFNSKILFPQCPKQDLVPGSGQNCVLSEWMDEQEK